MKQSKVFPATEIGKRLERLRKRAGFSRARAAKQMYRRKLIEHEGKTEEQHLKMTENTIQAIEEGRQEPYFYYVVQMATLYGVDLDYFTKD